MKGLLYLSAPATVVQSPEPDLIRSVRGRRIRFEGLHHLLLDNRI
jgi:hypothetical protein